MKSSSVLMVLLAVGVTLAGCGGMEERISHRYDHSAQPPPVPPGTPASPPGLIAPAPEVLPSAPYEPTGDDPTIVVIVNRTNKWIRIEIDGMPPIRRAPYQPTADLPFKFGDHRVKVVIEKHTIGGGATELIQFYPVSIRPEGRSQTIIYVHE